MKSKLYHILLIAVLAVSSVFSWNVYAEKKQSQQVVWEYNLVYSMHGDNRAQLSELGNEGWELVSVRTEEQMIGNFRQTKLFYYLKRPRQK
jgi:lipopolysaccharide export system protein LptC